jgi:hypothetical protein
MPREPMDYSKCVIYKIICRDPSVEECYVGHTTHFVKRKYWHKCCCKTNNLKLYQTIREHGGWENWIMLPLEEYKECENFIQACIKEEFWRIQLVAELNSQRAFLSEKEKQKRDKEYREKNKEKAKEWRNNNKEQIVEYKKEYAQINKEKLAEKDKIKYQKNRQKKLEYAKAYREANKEEIKEKDRLRRYQKKLVQSSEK